MLAVKPLIVEVKVPVPVPSVVFVLRDTVGPVLVDQTTPRAVIPPPSNVMLPPLLASVAVIEPIEVVVKVAASALTVMLPVAFILPQPPVRGMVYVKLPAELGVPLIVIVLAVQEADTPAGNPVAVPIPVAPLVLWVIGVKAE